MLTNVDSRRIALIAVLLGLLGLIVVAIPSKPIDSPPVQIEQMVDVSRQPDIITIDVRIRPGDTTGGLLQRFGLPLTAILDATSVLDGVDFTRIRPDRTLTLIHSDDRLSPSGIRYQLDEDRTLVIVETDGAWTASIDELAYTSALRRISFDVNRSLWADGTDAGLRAMDIVRLAKIFEYEIDFNSEIRKGAEFILVADQLTPPADSGAKVKLGEIHAIRMVNDEKVYTAARFVMGDDEGWYHPDGSGMERPFLRSPLEFSRISSKFNPKRFHPILKKRRPHNGTDFAANTGTTVRSVADGTVVFAGTSGGHGRFVKVKHASGIQTSYSHLSRVTVRKGARVRQGERVGLVGSSGLATGPHLHYQMWKNGRYVDAMKVVLPRSKPLPKAKLAEFERYTAPWLKRLDGDTLDQ